MLLDQANGVLFSAIAAPFNLPLKRDALNTRLHASPEFGQSSLPSAKGADVQWISPFINGFLSNATAVLVRRSA